MKKPIIGIAPLYDSALESMWMFTGYFTSIEASGGIPVMLSLKSGQDEINRLLDVADGVLLPGGNDINPLYYGENITEYCAPTVPDLDKMGIMLVKTAYERGIPIFGICRGCQLINVALGGTLYQDIIAQTKPWTVIIHSQKKIIPKNHPIHNVVIDRNSLLYEITGKQSLMVNSLHHQACKYVSDNLYISSRADDYIIEAVESMDKNKFVLGVQWHPELMFNTCEDARKLFKYFIDKAAELLSTT